MTDYREAKCIELHDSNISLSTSKENYAFTAPIGRTAEPSKPAFSIKLHDVAMLAEMFNIQTSDRVKVSKLSDQPVASQENERIEFIEMPIYKNHFDASDDPASKEEITKIECQIVTERIVNIKVTSQNDQSSETYTEEISYSGAFTIWWS